MMFFVVLMVKTAWLGDDAYISFRPLENLVNGYGLRWNVAERVQVYTDPAWVMLVLLFYAITHEIYLTVIALSMAVSFAAVLLLVKAIASSRLAAITALSALISSKAFIDYTTSGLENALGYLLVACFAVQLLKAQPESVRFRRLVFVSSLAVFNRLDLALLLAPAIAYTAWLCWRSERVPFLSLLRRAALYSFPVWGWLIFSLVYFGFAFPNTYYAKLHTSLPSAEVYTQGLLYYLNSLERDPVTLITLGLVLAAACSSRRPHLMAGAIGISLYLLYVVKIGGDFMSGRFFSVPLFLGIAFLAHLRFRPITWVTLAATFLGVGLLVQDPSILANESYGAGKTWQLSSDFNPHSSVDGRGIADEREAYYQNTGLLPVWRHNRQNPKLDWVAYGQATRAKGRQLMVYGNPGFFGFYAGPEVHILDPYALGDPLLSKCPVIDPGNWRIGHFQRGIPAGYIVTLQTGINLIEDANVRELYESIRILTRDPIWSWMRFVEIAKMNLGFYRKKMEAIAALSLEKPPEYGTTYPWPPSGEKLQDGRLYASVQAGWARETDGYGDFWWCQKDAAFRFTLLHGSQLSKAIVVPVQFYGRNVTLQVQVNGNNIQTELLPADATSRFLRFRLQGPWVEGVNTLNVKGQGEPVQPGPHDLRPLLFAVREPYWD